MKSIITKYRACIAVLIITFSCVFSKKIYTSMRPAKEIKTKKTPLTTIEEKNWEYLDFITVKRKHNNKSPYFKSFLKSEKKFTVNNALIEAEKL